MFVIPTGAQRNGGTCGLPANARSFAQDDKIDLCDHPNDFQPRLII
jgi:hypothetical protein